MKISCLRLKGYIKVLNGMGLDEIVIPFNTFKNRIVLVQGENGCSKSTIISALSPNPDSSDSYRTDVFIDEAGNRQIIEYPAEKEIHYVGYDEDGSESYYKILIQSLVDDSRTRRTTKAFISKNGEELNPNGNVASFKEIRDSIMGIDPIYLDLSSVSAENRGIVDMIPSERRKYMASYIGSLDTYNNIFKIISKKVSTLKSYMNTLSSKIYELGDESEMRLKLMQMEKTLTELNETRDRLLKDLAGAEATVSVIDPDGKMQDLYASISGRLVTLNDEMSENQENLDLESRRSGIDAENSDLDDLLKSTNDSIKDYTDQITAGKSEVFTLIHLNEAASSSLESDRAILSGLSTNAIQDNIEVAVENLRKEVSTYENYLTKGDIKVLDSVSLMELLDLQEAVEEFTKEIAALEEYSGYDNFMVAAEYAMQPDNIKRLESTVASFREEISDYDSKIINLKRDLSSAEEDMDTLKNFDNTRPKECKIDTCPYIAKYIKLKQSGTSEVLIKDLEKQIAVYSRERESRANAIENLETQIEAIRRIDIAFSAFYAKKSIITRIPDIAYLKDPGSLRRLLMNRNKLSDREGKKIAEYIEKSSTYDDLKKAREQLKSLESDLTIYQNNKTMIDSLTASIAKNEKEYKERESKIVVTTRNNAFMENVVSELNVKIATIEKLITLKTTKASLVEEKAKLKDEFDSVKDKIKIVKEKMDSVNVIKGDLSRVEESIKPISEAITQVKYDLTNIVNYQQEYKDCADRYDKVVFIRNACSPGNGMGIQSEYIKRYMNDIIIDCNKLLGYMFNGTIQLDVPIINEKQFSIPFLGPNGIMVPDISNGSTAQKCMIGLVFSCVAMMKSSLKYNIPRFDEIDGGLDQQNRVMFISVLNQILDFMHSEQCIICSHNMEFDTQSTTRLVCSHTGIKIEQ